MKNSFLSPPSMQKFFRLTNLRKLTLCENDLNRISPGIANFTRLVELDISKNGKFYCFFKREISIN